VLTMVTMLASGRWAAASWTAEEKSRASPLVQLLSTGYHRRGGWSSGVLRSWQKGDGIPIWGSAEGDPQGHAWSRCGARGLRTACLAFPSVLRGQAIQSSPVSPGQGSVATYWAADSVTPFVGLIAAES
jgi:hypothetical protein